MSFVFIRGVGCKITHFSSLFQVYSRDPSVKSWRKPCCLTTAAEFIITFSSLSLSSHSLHRLQSQDVEGDPQDRGGRLAQQQPAVVDLDDLARLVLLDAVAGVVELGEGGGDLYDTHTLVL